jgi:hypothetical protein
MPFASWTGKLMFLPKVSLSIADSLSNFRTVPDASRAYLLKDTCISFKHPVWTGWPKAGRVSSSSSSDS